MFDLLPPSKDDREFYREQIQNCPPASSVSEILGYQDNTVKANCPLLALPITHFPQASTDAFHKQL